MCMCSLVHLSSNIIELRKKRINVPWGAQTNINTFMQGWHYYMWISKMLKLFSIPTIQSLFPRSLCHSLLHFHIPFSPLQTSSLLILIEAETWAFHDSAADTMLSATMSIRQTMPLLSPYSTSINSEKGILIKSAHWSELCGSAHSSDCPSPLREATSTLKENNAELSQ